VRASGAAQARGAALTTASAEMKWINGWSAANYGGEFSGGRAPTQAKVWCGINDVDKHPGRWINSLARRSAYSSPIYTVILRPFADQRTNSRMEKWAGQ
jgi:hypothetical protein